MCPCQCPSAKSCIVEHCLIVENFHHGFDLHISQLPHIKMTACNPHAPTEKNIVCSLHHLLSMHYPLTIVFKKRFSGIPFQHGGCCFFYLQKEWLITGCHS